MKARLATAAGGLTTTSTFLRDRVYDLVLRAKARPGLGLVLGAKLSGLSGRLLTGWSLVRFQPFPRSFVQVTFVRMRVHPGEWWRALSMSSFGKDTRLSISTCGFDPRHRLNIAGLSVSYKGKYSGLSNRECGFDSRHGFQASQLVQVAPAWLIPARAFGSSPTAATTVSQNSPARRAVAGWLSCPTLGGEAA